MYTHTHVYVCIYIYIHIHTLLCMCHAILHYIILVIDPSMSFWTRNGMSVRTFAREPAAALWSVSTISIFEFSS